MGLGIWGKLMLMQSLACFGCLKGRFGIVLVDYG